MPRAIDAFVGDGAQKHVDAYFEYSQLVGRLDGGKPLSEPAYEAIKRKALDPARRLYVNWRNTENGIDCKAIGPQSMCLCTHRYNEHDWSDFEGRRVRCKMPGCTCTCFSYVPVRGAQIINCSNCKRGYNEHRPLDHGCPTGGGTFTSSFVCSCTGTYPKHKTVFESRDERTRAGRAIDTEWMCRAVNEGLPVCHLGGILGFTSMADGVDRVMAGLEQGIDPEVAMSYGAIGDGGANQFVRRMQLHDDVTSASIVHGKAEGFRVLAKARQHQQENRARGLPAPLVAPPAAGPPASRALSVPGASRGNVHGFSSGTSASSSAAGPSAMGGVVSKAMPKAQAPGPIAPGRQSHPPGAKAPSASRQAPQPGGKAPGVPPRQQGLIPSVVGAAAPRSKSMGAPSATGGHRLGGVGRNDPNAMRQARLKMFEG